MIEAIIITVFLLLVFAKFLFINDRILKKQAYIPKVKILTNEIEVELFSLINIHRESIGLSLLKTEKLACDIAREGVVMAIIDGDISHNYFEDRFAKTKATIFGEIAAKGFTTAKSILAAYLRSEEHKRIIESDKFRWIGISIEDNINYCLFTSYEND